MIGIKKINYYLMEILLFFALFDSARNYTLLPSAFGYIKDISIYMLFVLNLKKLKMPKQLGMGFYGWMFMILLFTPIGFLYASSLHYKNILIYTFKFYEIFILFVLFYNWKKIINISLEKYVLQYIYGTLALCFVNIFGYFIKNPFVSIYIGRFGEQGLYRGRITVGQPPIAIFPVILAFVFLIFSKKKLQDYFLIFFYLFCIIIATSNTGIIALLAVGIIAIINEILRKKKIIKEKIIKKIILMVFFAFIIGLFVYLLLNISSLNSIISLYQEKLVSYLSTGKDVSMRVRKQNWANTLNNITGISKIWGKGALGYANYKYQESTLIENTYIMTYAMYGYLGMIFLITFLIRCIKWSVKRLIHNDKKQIILLCFVVIYALHFYTLDFYLLYMLYFPFALFIIYFMDDDIKN